MKKILLFCGIAAPLVYVFTVILGGALRPGYSHTAQSVSSLVGADAPNKSLLDPMFALYNILVLAFGIGLFQIIRADPANPRRGLGLVGAAILILEGVFGFATLFFPEPAKNVPINFTGTMHITLAGLSSVATMLTMLLMGFWFRTTLSLRRFGTYSFLSVLAVFISGGFAAAGIASNSPLGGLIERITIGGFMQWLFVVGLKLYASEPSVTAKSARTLLPRTNS